MDFSLESYVHCKGMDLGKKPHASPIWCSVYTLYPVEINEPTVAHANHWRRSDAKALEAQHLALDPASVKSHNYQTFMD